MKTTNQMETTHTPGPWITEAFDTANGTAEQVFAMIDGTPVEVCDVSPDHEDGGVANARLIAAAPELLGALQAVASWYANDNSEDGDMPTGIFDAMHAALAKAKGNNTK